MSVRRVHTPFQATSPSGEVVTLVVGECLYKCDLIRPTCHAGFLRGPHTRVRYTANLFTLVVCTDVVPQGRDTSGARKEPP